MEMFDNSVVLMALALVLAIGIERMLELLRAIADFREARNGTVSQWQQRAAKLRDRLAARLEVAKGADPTVHQRVLMLVARYLSPAPAGSGATIAISSDQIRTLTIKLACRLYGMALGVVFAFAFDLNLFTLVDLAMQQEWRLPIALPGWLGVVLSGIAMGLGAGPVHNLITALERARKSR